MNMRQRFHAMRAVRNARGLSLITAVFLVVVLAGLAAAIVRLTLVQQAGSAMDLQGVQAYNAARSGLEWGIFQQLRVQPPAVTCFASQRSFAMPDSTTAGSMRNFTVTVSCLPKTGNAVGDTTNRWTISAVACNQPEPSGDCPNLNPSAYPDYVQRRVQAELN